MKKQEVLDFEAIRKITISAIAAHDDLCNIMILKGGNALELIHRIGNRSSLDLDFSMDGDVENTHDLKDQLVEAVTDRFDAEGFVVFDTRIEFKPQPKQGLVPDWWGGYSFTFKIISRNEYKLLKGNLESLRRNASVIDDKNRRRFEIQISRSEYCVGSEEKEIDGFLLKVYSTSMIACEKLRAICQQMPEYEVSAGVSRSARARDFYDIYMLVQGGHVDFTSTHTHDILKAMFAVKKVPLQLLDNIERDAEHHRSDWPKVVNAVRGEVHDFEFYVQFVVRTIEALKSLGVINFPG